MLLAVTAMLLTVFNACQEDELKPGQGNDLTVTGSRDDISLEDDYLVFKDFSSADSTVNLLCNKEAEAQLEWEHPLGFTSAKTYRAEICDKLQSMEDSAQMLNYVNGLAETGYFCWKDSSVTYPFFNYSWDGVLNPDGFVKIGNSLYYFGKTSQAIALDGKKETITAYLNGETEADSTTLLVFKRLSTKLMGNAYGSTLKSVSKRSGRERLTVQLLYDAIPYEDETIKYIAEKVYYELYYHQEKKHLLSWHDRHTHFHYYPEDLEIGGPSSDPYDEWYKKYTSDESKEWHLLNSSGVANYYDKIWTSPGQLKYYSEVDGGYYFGPQIVMDYRIYSGQVGSETDSLQMLVTIFD